MMGIIYSGFRFLLDGNARLHYDPLDNVKKEMTTMEETMELLNQLTKEQLCETFRELAYKATFRDLVECYLFVIDLHKTKEIQSPFSSLHQEGA